jgi:hypothetical protein
MPGLPDALLAQRALVAGALVLGRAESLLRSLYLLQQVERALG